MREAAKWKLTTLARLNAAERHAATFPGGVTSLLPVSLPYSGLMFYELKAQNCKSEASTYLDVFERSRTASSARYALGSVVRQQSVTMSTKSHACECIWGDSLGEESTTTISELGAIALPRQ